MQKTIEIIYADSGGGHRSLARTIGAAMGDDYTVRLVNATEISRVLFEQFEIQYAFLIRYAPWLYQLIYIFTDNIWATRWMEFWLGAFFGKEMRRYLAQSDADLLISCHLIVNLLMAGQPRRMAYVNVVADPFTPHADSFSNAADLCIVGSDSAKKRALTQGVDEEKVRVAGHPVAARANVAKRSALKGLGLAESLPTLLITGGGEGFGKLWDVAIHLNESGLAMQMIVVCGRNLRLYAALRRRKFNMPVCVLPFTEEMPTLMQAADVLVSKAGPSTIFEGFQAGLPIILFDAILGQEAGNVAHVCKNGAGVFCKSPAAVVSAVRHLLHDAAALRQMSARSLALATPSAASDVAQACISLIQEKP